MKQILSGIFLFIFFSVNAQENSLKHQSIFMFNFARQVHWDKPNEVFVIGVYGSPQMFDELTLNLKGKKIDTRDIQVVSINSTAEITRCEMIYLSSSDSKLLDEILKKINGNQILLITEEDLAEEGAPISFLFVENKLRFKINLTAIGQTKLQVSKNLLALAIVI
jgi:hypothetical protein